VVHARDGVIGPGVDWYKIFFIMSIPTERQNSAQRDKVYICDQCNAVIAAPIRGKYGFPLCDLGHNVVERRSFLNRFLVGVVIGAGGYLVSLVFGGLNSSSTLGEVIFVAAPSLGIYYAFKCIRLAKKPPPQRDLMPGQLGTGLGMVAGFTIALLLDLARMGSFK
jgi:hypothetical protein